MLTRTLLLTGLRDLTRRPWQTGLMLLGLALGVAVVIAIDLANTSARTAFDLSTQAVIGRATHHILSGPTGLDENLYRELRIEHGYRDLAPVVEGLALAPALDEQPLRLLGIDPFAEAPFRSYLGGQLSGRAGIERFYTEPGTVLIGAGLAEHYGLTLNSPIALQIADRLVTVTVVGLLNPQDANNRRALDGLLVMDISTAQELLGLSGRLTRIDVIATPDEANALAALLPPHIRLAPANEQAATAAQLTEAFQLNLTALSLLALVVGMFLIYNTIMFSVVQRRRVLGILRALGVTGGQIFTLILFEAGVVSIIGATLGVGLGWVLGQGAVRLVTQTINDLYFVLTVRETQLTALTVIKGVGAGLGAGLLAAFFPALEAANVEPVTIMRASTLEDRVRAWLPKLSLGGVFLIGLGTALELLFTSSLFTAFSGLFAIILGLALLVPATTVGLMHLLGPTLNHAGGVLGRIAARTVVKTLSRTSVAIAALMVAISVTIGVSVMIASFRATLINWLNITLLADIYVSPTVIAGAQAVTIDATLPARLAQLPGVHDLETLRQVVISSEFGDVRLSATSSQRPRSTRLYRTADNVDPWAALQGDAILVSEPFAFHHHLPAHNATLTLRTDSGDHTFAVAGIYYDYASDQGRLLMSAETYHRHWNDRAISGLAVYAAPGVDPAALADSLRAELRGTALQVQVNRALRDEALMVFDRTFAITNALRLLAVVVAFIGVLSALMALQIERARELATLQALGLTAGQLWRLTLLETGLMGATAGLLSLPTGFVLALVLIYVINLRSFGWTIQMEPEWLVYVQAFGVSVLAALLAAIYPMRRLLKMPVATALRQE